ncbi:unnamed protein product [Linum trigynum]|uniref:WEB family protein n=1 Tax=Linum trigynum TaxID=586398 RepID=A0AAV2F8Q1_9ROSI
MDGREEGGVSVMGRAEIDTRAPFKSVREAVMLFGERVLAGEIYATKLKEIKSENEKRSSGRARAEAELEETKLSLMKAKEEGNLMAYRIKSLRQELELTKKELNQIKTTQKYNADHQDKQWSVSAGPRGQDPEIEEEDLKFMETAANFNDEEQELELEKKRYVKFASPPSLAKVMVAREDMMRQRSASSPRGATPSSYGKKSVPAAKRRSIGPVLGWLFHKKKGGGPNPSPGADAGLNTAYDYQSSRY